MSVFTIGGHYFTPPTFSSVRHCACIKGYITEICSLLLCWVLHRRTAHTQLENWGLGYHFLTKINLFTAPFISALKLFVYLTEQMSEDKRGNVQIAFQLPLHKTINTMLIMVTEGWRNSEN